MSKRALPNHIPGTVKKWRIRKRKEWKRFVKEFDNFRLGCAYTPMYKKYDALISTMNEITADMRGNWRP